jgi:hypothetical protein
MHLQAGGDEESCQDRMEHVLASLEQAIVEDAERPDLWQQFRAWLHEQLKPLQEQQEKKDRETVRKRRGGT